VCYDIFYIYILLVSFLLEMLNIYATSFFLI